MRARIATLLVLAAVAGCGGEDAAPTTTEAGGTNPTSTIGESAVAGAPEGLERTQPPQVPSVPERASDALFSLQPVVEGLEEPVYVAAPASEPERLYVVERAGRILVVENGELREEAFLDIRGRVRSEIE